MTSTYLIVDDSPIIRRVLNRCLGMSGLPADRILEAADGEAAWDVLSSEPIACLFCDLHMPGLDGIGLLQRLADRGLLHDLPVVVISSDRSRDRITSLMTLGVRAFLTKPFTPEQIYETAGRVMGVRA